ncbi:response regulator transcription factor [Streptococcus sp. 20-1249]|uniref:response regulator transcription factor n=1 Tax=Streptococcus hepaticus TaxID=3349163 RepID=UPI003748147B
MVKIMVVEDDPVINQVVCEFLGEQGYQTLAVFDGKLALEAFQDDNFDLIILDVMIPSCTGIEVLKEIRKTSQVPIMMLTAMDDEYTQLVSFNHLISDYVTKPFSPLILMKRVENILRNKLVPESLSVVDIQIFPEEGCVELAGQSIDLTKKEYDILLYLVKRKGQIVSRSQLMTAIWGYEELDSRVLDNHMKNLRKKLPSLPLKTVIGRGYRVLEE